MRPTLLVLFAVALPAVPPADATVLRYLPVEELADRSTACVLATVVETETSWSESGEVPVTRFRLEPSRVLFGEVPPGALVVSRVGGEVDGVALGYAGMVEMQVGERVVVFLARCRSAGCVVTGMSQGVLRERGPGYSRDLSSVSGAPGAEERWTIDDLLERLGPSSGEPTVDP